MYNRFISGCLAITLIASFLVMPPQTVIAATNTVTNTSDSGEGSLRAAIDKANTTSGPDTITFDATTFPSGSPATIILASPLVLSDTTGGTTINGDGGVILTRAATTDRWECFQIRSSNNAIRGLQIHGFWVGIQFVNGVTTGNNTIGGTLPSQRNIISNNEYAGVYLDGPGCANNLVIGNYIGLNHAGTAAWGGIQATGVSIEHGAHNNVIGGTTPGERNVISGNTMVGVVIGHVMETTNNRVQGNYIGTDYTGMVAIPNDYGGVCIDLNATGNIIGGTVAGSGNIISGHTGSVPHGIRISRTSGNYVYGNIIGLAADGTTSLENGRGVQLEYGANNNYIGGSEANMRNIISGNGNAEIMIYESNGNTIQGNYIGTDITGTLAIGADYAGIVIENSANNIVGGTVAGARNLISGNTYYGVHIYGAGTTNNPLGSTNNKIMGNYIGTDISGTLSLGNQNDGVRIGGGAYSNIIGGTTSGERNIISGNLHYGIAIQHTDTINNQIMGNYIGTDVSGTKALGNGEIGIILDESPSGTIIGGTAAGAGNVISGNNGTGIQIGNYSSYTQVSGNFIGTDKTGTISITNKGYGVMIGGSAHHNTVGGSAPGARNVISGNKWLKDGIEPNGTGVGILSNSTENLIIGNYIGVDVSGVAALGNDYGVHVYSSQNNVIKENVIHNNTVRAVNIVDVDSMHITITQNSISGNDGTAIEGGICLSNNANQSILPPVITTVTANTVTGTTAASDGSIVEIFQDAGKQGNIYIGSATVSGGNFSFAGSAPSGATGGNLTATVTDTAGNTSMFSSPVVNNLGITSPPEQQIEEIRDEFDDAVSDGGLVGEGPGNSANGKLKALRNMLERAEELIDQGMIDEAIQQLEDAYKRIDGNPKPPDFATGVEADKLAMMILNLIEHLRNL